MSAPVNGADEREVIWECKIGGAVPGEMPNGWDAPMRRAVKEAFRSLTGVEAEFTFSGSGHLAEVERAVVEKRQPRASLGAAQVPVGTQAKGETPLIAFEDAHETAWCAAAAFRPSYFSGKDFQAHSWVVEAIRSAHLDGQRFALGLPKVDRKPNGIPVYVRERAAQAPTVSEPSEESTAVELWAEIWRLREAGKGPAGYATWQDAATDERIRRVRAENALAALSQKGDAK